MANDFGLKQPKPPATPKNPGSWPAWYYSAEGESRIFNGPDEVPDGWATSPYNAKALAREHTKEKELMPRKDVIAELKKRGIRYDYSKPTGELWQLLRDVRAHEGALEDNLAEDDDEPDPDLAA